MSGPLHGLKVLEMPAIGPVPFCGMLLADLGADVLRLDRTGDSGLGLPVEPRFDLLGRGKRSLALDLKATGAIELVCSVMDKADIVIEGFRPGTMERLGLGPDGALKRNPRLVYGRMTGWGQDGPLASAAGHDINYLSLTGALHAIGRKHDAPVPPLNLAADFGGGALYLALGVMAAIHERQHSGRGQVIDAAMVDGASSLMAMFYGLLAQGLWRDERGVNILDSGAPWYDTYRCSDGRYVSVGAIEPKFFTQLARKLEIDAARFPNHMDPRCWPEIRGAFAEAFARKTREQWCALLEGSDGCFAPVLALREAPRHHHIAARQTFVEREGVVQPAPAPRFSRTPGSIRRAPPRRGDGGAQALREWGVDAPRG
ncbi:MAG TPA: CaiB/BaiF CoA-transferase family protein [Ramlibacter sp.]|nr:CaiB/BaiF CoA-transferase family protein [Ramlibacter sp.]